ncbi:hypothetical protein CesoFtcFv8_007195 [Champsocephalus esox]|uniref:Uncharacterized protein n=1 Tax=Champsocephalus esox TaxID=159716 RepID=A0AAN8H4M2_9TELE|nr:hypothetical protein CesoFtcFv8_007195 [Champsocephalus esox]
MRKEAGRVKAGVQVCGQSLLLPGSDSQTNTEGQTECCVSTPSPDHMSYEISEAPEEEEEEDEWEVEE